MDKLMKKFNKYANEVVSYIDCDYNTKLRIKEDIMETLHERNNELMEEDPIKLMGEAYVVACEFGENIGDNISINNPNAGVYRSDKEIFGMPFVCISRNKRVTAKGFIAIGAKSVGIISIGGVSIGVISLGGVAIGLLTFGGVSIGLLMALGGVSMSWYWALGGVAMAKSIAMGGVALAKNLAIGGVAVAKDVAIGGAVSAKLAGYTQKFVMPSGLDEGNTISFKYPVYKQDLRNAFDRMFQNFGAIKKWLVNLFTK